MTKHYSLLAALFFAMIPSLATADDVEITASFIKNPSFEQDFTDWTNSGMQTQSNSDFKPKAGKKYAEKWTASTNKIGNTSVVQTINQLPAGHYRLTAAAQNILQSSDVAQTGATIFAGTAKTTVTVAGTYEVVFDGTGKNIQIGFRCTNATGNWVATDNFQLFFTGADAETLASNIAQAETLLEQAMQEAPKTALQNAVDAAKALAEEAPQADIDAAALALINAFAPATESINTIKALNTALTAAKKLTEETMAKAVKDELLATIATAEAILEGTSEADVEQTTTKLNEATTAARNSHTVYNKLKNAISSANGAYSESKNGAEELKSAIDAAQGVLDNEASTDADYDAAATTVTDALLVFRVANGTGTTPKVKTGAVVQGATLILARGTFPSSGTREKGFCYSTTNPEPTIYDGRSTTKYTNNGDIYEMGDLTPASVYYVRAYAISTGYMVGYGDVVKTYTRPAGNVTYNYDYAGDAATNERIKAACEEGVWMWNNVSGIQGFTLSAHYVPGAGAGDGTAECSYGGNMNISQNSAYQRTGTILHEGSHGLGVISYTDWTNSIYRANGDRGEWLGPRVDRAIQFLENNASAKLKGDTQHMWPYGINGASEDTGSPILYRGNALIVGALAEDGIRTPNQNFIRPAYTFECQEDMKYYIKNESPERGLTTGYLRESQTSATATRPKWMAMTADEVLENDSCAWYVTFNPATCKYVIRNAATGHALTGAAFTTPKDENVNTQQMQLLASRSVTKNSGHTFASLSYWIVFSKDRTFAANANGSTSGATFNHANESTTQRWLFLDADEVRAFDVLTGISTLAKADAQVAISGGKGCISVSTSGQRSGQSVDIFTIDGRRVENVFVQNGATATISLPRGIYIVNGRKVLVR